MRLLTDKIKNLKKGVNLSKIIELVKSASGTTLYLTLGLILLETCFFFASLYLLKELIDIVAHTTENSAESYRSILFYVTLAALAGILYFISRSFSAYLVETQATKVAEHVNEQIHSRAVNLELSFYESPSYYDTLKRAMDSGSDRPSLVITTLIELLKNTMSLLAVGSVLILINWLLLPLLALFILPTLIVRLYYSKKLNDWRIAQTSLERKSSYYSSLITTDTAAKEIRAYNLGAYLKQQFTVIRNSLVKQKLSINFKRTKLEVFTTALANIGVFVCIGFIALKTVSGETSAGDITLFLVAFPQSFSILQNISGGISLLYQNSIYIESIFELLELDDNFSEDKQPLKIPDATNLSLSLKNVSFTYPHSKKPTLEGIDIEIPPGKLIAIAGLNGAGKSTLIKLLCRLYDPGTGAVSLGDTDIKKFSSGEYRRLIGIVFQDFNKYSFTAAENIYFGDITEPFDEERAREAAEKSGADQFIDQFPQKYQTVMGRLFDDGQEVSIGQWQKLALARCFYSNARFLILDEATSALDAASEQHLFETFRQSIGTRSAIIISHRHSALKHADHIYFLEGGKIIEQGTDASLIDLGGAYADLFGNVDD